MENTKISWCHHTFNPWMGCTKVSTGCDHCYAETLMDTRWGKVQWGPAGSRVRTSSSYWQKPRAWNTRAKKTGRRERVFCASLADVFEDREELVPWRDDLFNLIHETPSLDWLVLTKRPENISRLAADHMLDFENVWWGTSVENQEAANKRIPHLIKTPGAKHFLSCEPLLGPVNIIDQEWWDWRYTYPFYPEGMVKPVIDWVIVGGESGHNARPMDPEWARDLLLQCKRADIAFHFKQWGAYCPTDVAVNMNRLDVLDAPEMEESFPGHSTTYIKLGKKASGRLLDDKVWEEVPQ